MQVNSKLFLIYGIIYGIIYFLQYVLIGSQDKAEQRFQPDEIAEFYNHKKDNYQGKFEFWLLL